LEIFAAVQTRAQNEVAVQQRAGFAEKCKEIFFHWESACRWRAVSGGPPKTSRSDAKQVNRRQQMIVRHIEQRAFDELPNGARQRHALPGSGTVLPGCIICRMNGLRCGRNHLDFHVSSLGQRGNLDSGAGRGILFKIRAVYLVYRLKIAQAR
jgi:hypothetical protein